MNIRTIALPVASALLSVALVPAAAFAGSNSSVSSTTGATAQFIANGDSITVCDTASDGESVYAQYQINGVPPTRRPSGTVATTPADRGAPATRPKAPK